MSDTFVIGKKAEEIVTCCGCNLEMQGQETHTFKNTADAEFCFCATCARDIYRTIEEQAGSPKVLLGSLLGLLASFIGGLLWYFAATLTSFTIGYFGIALGYIIGKATWFGAGKRGSIVLQVIACSLTLATLVTSEFLVYCYYVGQHHFEQKLGAFQVAAFIWNHPEIANILKDACQSILSPIGLVIWGIALWTVHQALKPCEISIRKAE